MSPGFPSAVQILCLHPCGNAHADLDLKSQCGVRSDKHYNIKKFLDVSICVCNALMFGIIVKMAKQKQI